MGKFRLLHFSILCLHIFQGIFALKMNFCLLLLGLGWQMGARRKAFVELSWAVMWWQKCFHSKAPAHLFYLSLKDRYAMGRISHFVPKGRKMSGNTGMLLMWVPDDIFWSWKEKKNVVIELC